MKRSILIALAIIFSHSIWAQDVQWAYNILNFSSQKDSREYSAKQATGRPNVLPGHGESINAWQPKGSKEEESIKVGFFVPIKPKQVLIGESFNPGYISKVFVYDASGTEQEIASYRPGAVAEKSRVLRIPTPDINFVVFAVKVVLKPLKGVPVAIDAIGITESEKPYEVKINHADVVKSNMVVKKLTRKVNSKYPEHGPLLAPDGRTLYFSRSFDPSNIGGKDDYEDIWYSEWDDAMQDWGQSKNLGIPFNNKEPNYINSISPDGNTVLLGNSYSEKGIIGGGASITYRTANGWTTPRPIIIQEENNINDRSNYFLGNNQKVLLMSIERKKDSYGDRDIYVSFLQTDSMWSTPRNLGSMVNTLGTEAAPYLASDDRTLYYSSNGLGGYGGSDIYVTRRLDDTWQNWTLPENLGPIVNTANNESYFSVTGSGNNVFYTSIGDTLGDIDIYTLALPEIVKPLPVVLVKGRVLDSKTNKPVPDVKIQFENLKTGEQMGIARSNPEDATYEIMLPSGADYGFFAEKKGYMSTNANMELKALSEYEEVNKDLLLTPLESGESLVLNNVFFPTQKSILKEESHSELNRIVKILKEHPSMTVEVSGHTDNVGNKAYNDFLSFQRAKAVADYLTQKSGIEKSRIAVEYYGEANPVADNSTPQGRQMNRRVEFKILTK